MKNKFKLLPLLLIANGVYAQQTPTNNAPAGAASGFQSQQYWSRAGNNNNNGNNNIFGTLWNSPLYTVTNGVNRMKINGNLNYVVNGLNGARNGNVLIGISNNSMAGSGNIYTATGAFSLLHLNGAGTQYQEFGFRPWMDAGITLTANRDLSYLGLRKLSTVAAQEDITETVFLWSDNANAPDGPDKMVFRFSGFGGSDNSTVSANRLSSTDLDALHY